MWKEFLNYLTAGHLKLQQGEEKEKKLSFPLKKQTTSGLRLWRNTMENVCRGEMEEVLTAVNNEFKTGHNRNTQQISTRLTVCLFNNSDKLDYALVGKLLPFHTKT